MKKNSRLQRLVLARETVRKLADKEMVSVQGAAIYRPKDPTYANACTWDGGSLCDVTTGYMC